MNIMNELAKKGSLDITFISPDQNSDVILALILEALITNGHEIKTLARGDRTVIEIGGREGGERL